MTGEDTTGCRRNISDYPQVLTSTEVVELLHLPTDDLVQTMAREGRIPAHRSPGARRWRFDRDEVIAWLRSGATRVKSDGE